MQTTSTFYELGKFTMPRGKQTTMFLGRLIMVPSGDIQWASDSVICVWLSDSCVAINNAYQTAPKTVHDIKDHICAMIDKMDARVCRAVIQVYDMRIE